MSSIFGSFGQNNQQQQQQQPQQGGAFGQTPTAFGSGAGFAGFGQNQQQQQPQVNPMFGNLAAPSASTPGASGFGAFGNTPANNAFGSSRPAFGSTGASTFGQPQAPTFGPNTGGSIFGTGFGSTSTTGTSAFGQPSQPQQQNTFGSSTNATTNNMFGKPSAFGSTAIAPASASPVPATGTANPPFQEVQERDPTSASSSSMLRFQSITAMPEYRNASFEELRVQDYLQGRKVASSTSAFGSTAATSTFGQPSQSSTNLFSQPSATTNAFGQPQASTGFGSFGQNPQQQQQQPQQSTFGAFGQTQQQQPPAPSGFGAFGQQQTQQPSSGFSAFGQQNQQQQPSGAFGAFGQQNKGFGTFGSQPTQTNPSPFSAFGSNTNTATPAFGQLPQPQQQSGFGGFNQSNTQQQNAFSKPSIFGTQPSAGVFGAPANTQQQQQQPQPSIFGAPSATTQQPTQPGLFGGATAQQQSAFGQPQQPTQQTPVFGTQSTAGGGLFGNTNQQQQQNQQQPSGGFSSLFSKPAGSSIFGNGATNQPSAIQPLSNPNPNPSNPLFSGGGGLFGNVNNNQPAPSTTGGTLFGSAGAGTNNWGAKPTTSTTPFGSTGGLFGNLNQGPQQTQSTGPGLFGSTTQQPQQSSGGLFGSSTFHSSGQQQPQQQQQQQQFPLTASIDQPLPASLPSLPPLAASLTLDKKKSNIFADIALRTSPRLSLHYKPPSPSPKARSLTSSSTNRWQIPYSSSTQGSPNKLLPFSESKSLITPEAFASPGSLQLLNGTRHSVKKLVLDKRVEKDDIVRLRPNNTSDGKVQFNPALEAMARAKDNEPVTSVSPAKVQPPVSTSTSSPEKAASNGKVVETPLDPQEGEYWCLPTVSDLQRLSYHELQAVKDFTVGRVGYGTIQFQNPVDLTTVPSIADIPGKIITFEHMECTLYTDERLRPPPGEGLNVPARIKLDRCWALDKSTREPIKDPESLKYQQRLRKMQNQEGTEFVNFDKESGVWEFLVQEF